MNDERKNLSLMKNCDNYHKWISNWVRPFTLKKTLEVGPGEGSMTQLLYNKNYCGLDCDVDYVLKLSKKFGKGFRLGDITNSKVFKDESFDTVLLINVLEHVKDDVSALNNCYELLKKGGFLVGLFPAHPFLYGSVDKADGHFRRYSKFVLKKKLELAGFKITHCSAFNIPGFFGWLWHNKVLKVKVHKKGDLGLFNTLTPLFQKFETVFEPPFGLSWFVMAEKVKFYNYEGKEVDKDYLLKEARTVLSNERTKDVFSFLPENKKVLDVGCGIGVMAREMAETAEKVVGIDTSEDNVKIAKEFYCKNNLEYRCERLEQVRGKFDIITCCEVLEHVDCPLQFLKDCHSKLRKGGKIVITTPNSVSMTNVLLNRLKGMNGLNNEVRGNGTECDHISEWSIRTLTRLMNRAGFELHGWDITKHSIVWGGKKKC